MHLSPFLTVAVLTVGSVQQQPLPPQIAAPDASIARRIEAGDVRAIATAGASGNRAYIPALSTIVRGRRYEGFTDGSASEQARLALARLGAPEQLQQYWCAAISELPTVYALRPPIEMFQFIGGWYAVEALSYFLEPNADVHWRRAGRKQRELSDVESERPEVLA